MLRPRPNSRTRWPPVSRRTVPMWVPLLVPLLIFGSPTSSGAADLRLTLTPNRGTVGTEVVLRGHVPSADIALWSAQWRHPAYFALVGELPNSPLPGGEACEIVAAVGDGRIHLDSKTGRVTGSFRVLSEGACFQTDVDGVSLQPGVYGLSIGCHACQVGTFTVTGSLARTGPQLGTAAVTALMSLGTGSILVFLGARRKRNPRSPSA
jgi:hypothetical protein